MQRSLAPAYGQMPAQSVLGSLAQHALVSPQLKENRQRLRAQGGGCGGEKIDQCANSQQTIQGAEPLRPRHMPEPIGIPGSLLQQQRHRIFIGGKVLEERAHIQPLCQPLQGVFVAGQSLPVHKDVELRIIPFDDDVQTCRHVLSLVEIMAGPTGNSVKVIQSITGEEPRPAVTQVHPKVFPNETKGSYP
jgi:hypothetical protein